jgi:hypothetical protein
MNSKIEAKASWFSHQRRQDETKRNLVLTLSRTRQKRPGSYKIFEERSESKGISQILSKNEGKTNRCVPKISENVTERSEIF